MSRTEINFINKHKVTAGAEISNSWRGAMAIWTYFKEKYKVEPGAFMTEKEWQPVWALVNDDRLSRAEKIVLASTFDWVVVRREEAEELCKAFEDLNIGSTAEQAKAIREALEQNKKINFITWNQTSVCENQWLNYSLNKGKKHWFLFDDLNEDTK